MQSCCSSRWWAGLTLLVIQLATGLSQTAAVGAEPDILVGVNYFAGWWSETPNKWQDTRDGHDWLRDWPGRTPLLGQYNTQDVMDREIVAAADHGVDFFAILWYYNDPGKEREPNARLLNRGLDEFLRSPNARRLRFLVEFCNAPPYEVTTDEQWSRCVDTWVDAMRHPSYLRVGNRLVFKVHSWHHFMVQNGRDVFLARRRLDRLRGAARRAGLGEMIIGAGVGAEEAIPGGHPLARSGLFDFTATYMEVPDLKPADADYPYSRLAALADRGRRLHGEDAVPWMPYLPAGWCPRPWHDPRPCFAVPDRNDWKAALTAMASDLRSSKHLGLPQPGGTVQRVFTIYAWNEFGEGGIVAPTRGNRTMKLEGIREVFGGDRGRTQ
jgi:hypothetical protein